jgi:acyl carrier protein
MTDSTLDRVKSVFGSVLTGEQLEKFNANATMDDIDGWDSLNFLNIIMGLEHEFNIRIDGLDAATMTSVPDILEYLEKT